MPTGYGKMDGNSSQARTSPVPLSETLLLSPASLLHIKHASIKELFSFLTHQHLIIFLRCFRIFRDSALRPKFYASLGHKVLDH
ncbi:hypothetical protein CEXT_126721 [Caerostris extrusa]|uniref:Maturase K n=1 Tax=Caerostris extrusa TaxID=172846 RepID=A0AAV4XPG1_CAEEX|nr:hypothetical protein CEXT_126721 [Caerostris extrusa]